MHGVNMVFFFLIPSVPATLGNFPRPDQIGPRTCFSQINLLSWYIFVIGACFSLAALTTGALTLDGLS